jgi:hypothetical protein
MKYAKPELTVTARAETLIRGGLKGGSHLDGDGSYVTSPAYEADE